LKRVGREKLLKMALSPDLWLLLSPAQAIPKALILGQTWHKNEMTARGELLRSAQSVVEKPKKI
jgi:hypothetical protein